MSLREVATTPHSIASTSNFIHPKCEAMTRVEVSGDTIALQAEINELQAKLAKAQLRLNEVSPTLAPPPSSESPTNVYSTD